MKHGIVLIFDEVMTSRLGPGGMQQSTGVIPDMTSLGKYLGGGMSFGAFGGRADLMQRYDPTRADAVSHAGTFNNNVLSMAAGVKGLRDIYTAAAATALSVAGETLKARVNALARKHDADFQMTGVGSILNFHFHRGTITKPEDWWPVTDAAAKRLDDKQKLFHLDMLEAGQYLARRGFVTLSLPMAEPMHERFLAAIDEFLTVRAAVLD